MRRVEYDIFASYPIQHLKKKKYFYEICDKNNLLTIVGTSEKDRINKIKNKQFEIIVVGNVGRIEEIATESSLTVMVYHGIGLKQHIIMILLKE